MHAPTPRERERRAGDLACQRNDDQRERRPTAPEAHAEMRNTRDAKLKERRRGDERRKGRSKAKRARADGTGARETCE